MQSTKRIQKTPELKLKFTPPTNPVTITGQESATNYLRAIWDTDLLSVQEQVYVVFLNNAHQVICWRCLYTGGTRECTMDTKLVFSLACGCLASAVLIAHNHPSGKLVPSMNDIHITKKLKKAGEMMDIVLMDHLILTRQGSYSVLYEKVYGAISAEFAEL